MLAFYLRIFQTNSTINIHAFYATKMWVSIIMLFTRRILYIVSFINLFLKLSWVSKLFIYWIDFFRRCFLYKHLMNLWIERQNLNNLKSLDYLLTQRTSDSWVLEIQVQTWGTKSMTTMYHDSCSSCLKIIFSVTQRTVHRIKNCLTKFLNFLHNLFI